MNFYISHLLYRSSRSNMLMIMIRVDLYVLQTSIPRAYLIFVICYKTNVLSVYIHFIIIIEFYNYVVLVYVCIYFGICIR